MGAKDWMLAFAETDPRAALRGGPVLDRAAARTAAERLYPGRTVTPVADGIVGDDANPDDGLVYVTALDGLTLVCTGLAAVDRPSQVPVPVLTAIPASRVYLHAMHSVVDWFAYAVWTGGHLRRSLSLSPDDGVIENLGEPMPFERPYWAGRHPAIDPEDTDPDDDPYPLPFHPLDLAETALQEILGFSFEGRPRPDDVDPFEIPLAGFAIT